jgi:PAS domain S-box-containing protein
MAEGKQWVLVVEDDELSRDMLSRRLERSGYAVSTAENGEQALNLISKTFFDLVLLDHMMPGLSGLDVLQRIRREYNPTDLPVIMVTAMNESDNIVQALELGANDYVTKPVDYAVALARIQTQMERRAAQEALRKSESRHRAILESALDGILTVGHDGKVIEANWSAEAMFSLERGTMPGCALGDFVSDQRQLDARVPGLLRYPDSESSSLGRRAEAKGRRVGVEFPLEVSVVRIDEIHPPTYCYFLRDISNRKQHEQQLKALSEALKAWEKERSARQREAVKP